ncbi:MAG: class I SAM-dependent methyltransferase [Lewinellaceae bacterium]|nr:class I SAM-dependent methyltransferase [Lewinellaceae bacterium]
MKSLYRKLLVRLHPYKTLHFDYLMRMRTSLAGESMLHEGNIYALDYACRHLPDEGAVLEIGSFAGMSANVISWLLRQHHKERPFYTCDPWIYDGYHDHIKADDPNYMAHFEGSQNITREEYTDFIRESFIRNTSLFSRDLLPHAIQLHAQDFFKAWGKNTPQTDVFGRKAPTGGPLSLVYIDGDHSYDAARQDVEKSLEWLVPGGFLLLDDSADFWQYGSALLAKEMRRWKNVSLVMKNPNYLYQKI